MTRFLILLALGVSTFAQSVDFPNQVKRKPFFDVRTYGAKGNGTNDDTAEIQAAINAAQTAGGTVFLPVGTYKVSSALNITEDHVCIVGDESFGSVLKSYLTTGSVLNFNGPAGTSGTSGIGEGNCVQKIKIDATNATSTAYAINLDTQNTAAIRDVMVILAANGIKVTGNSSFKISIDDTNVSYLTGSGVGILIEGGADHFLNRITMANNTSATAGIQITKSGGTWIDKVDIIGSGDCLLLNPSGASNTVNFIFVSNSAFDTCGENGVKIAPTSSASVNNVFFSNSWTASSDEQGVHITASGSATVHDVFINNHRSINNQKNGVLIDTSAVSSVYVTSSNISSNSQIGSGVWDGVHIAGAPTKINILGNRFGQSAGLPANQRTGIYLESGASNHLTIKDNIISDFTVTSIYGVAQSTGTSKIVEGNNPDNIIHTTIAAATSLNLGETPVERWDVSGTATVATITPAWFGRKLYLTFTNAAPGGLTTGGNIRKAKTIAQNETVFCIYDNSGWSCVGP